MSKSKKEFKKKEPGIDVCQEKAGFLDAEGEVVTQEALRQAVDITTAPKSFELKLTHGPYKVDYTKNGRYLLIGGERGHLASIDWQTKDLMFQIGLKMDHEEDVVRAVKWFHNELMFAAAQRQWTYVYDNKGVELHCLKSLDAVLQLEFLPRHFLLVSSNVNSYLTWLDVSTGQKVSGFATGLGRLDVMTQNPNNAIILLGHPGGTVTMWSPNVKEPIVKMLCHGSGTKAIAVDLTGNYMASSGLDRKLKIWDLRTYKCLHQGFLKFGASNLEFSQRGLLAASVGNVINIYKDAKLGNIDTPYMDHTIERTAIRGIKFCPYEDILGLGHTSGVQSLIIPGSGEPNFDALEDNPYQTKQQRKQMEVKMLLDKVPPDMITIDPNAIGKVNVKSLKEKIEEKAKVMYIKPKKIEFEPRNRKKGARKAGKIENRKQGVKDEATRNSLREKVKERQQLMKKEGVHEKRFNKKNTNVLDRFKKTN